MLVFLNIYKGDVMNNIQKPFDTFPQILRMEGGKKQRNQDGVDKSTQQSQKLKRSQDVKEPERKNNKMSNLTSEVQEGMEKKFERKSKDEQLQKTLLDLSAEIQEVFNEQLRNMLLSVAGIQSLFSSDNKSYQSEGPTIYDPQVSARYYKLRETEQKKYRDFCNEYENFITPFRKRIEIIQEVIRKHIFEIAYLKEAIIGNDSYLKSYSWTSLGYKYGASFRLSETNESLELRRAKLKLKKEDKPSEEIKTSRNTPSEIQSSSIHLSESFAALKEEVTVCNHALEKEAYEEVVKTDLPKIYYLYHKQLLDALKLEMDDLKPKKENQIKELDKQINIEQCNPGFPVYLNLQHERNEIAKRWDMITIRHQQIGELLNNRKKLFKFSEEVSESKTPIKPDELSPEMNQALELLKRIMHHKENTVLENSWENWMYEELRRDIYFQACNQTKELETHKEEFANKTLPARLKVLNSAIETYRRYIKTMEQGIQDIDQHFTILTKDAQDRAKWQVNPLPPPTPAPAPVSTPVLETSENKENN